MTICLAPFWEHGWQQTHCLHICQILMLIAICDEAYGGGGLDKVPRMGTLWLDWYPSRRKRYKLYFLPLYLQASKRRCEHLGSVVFKLKGILTSNQTDWRLYLDLLSLLEYERLMSVFTNPFTVLCCGSLSWHLKEGSFVYQHASPHDLLLCTELSRVCKGQGTPLHLVTLSFCSREWTESQLGEQTYKSLR